MSNIKKNKFLFIPIIFFFIFLLSNFFYITNTNTKEKAPPSPPPKIQVKLTDITVIGKVTLVGNVPKRLLLIEKDTEEIYEFDPRQENYQEFVENYQQRIVKVVGQYYTKEMTRYNGEIYEIKYLIADEIEIYND